MTNSQQQRIEDALVLAQDAFSRLKEEKATKGANAIALLGIAADSLQEVHDELLDAYQKKGEL